MKMKRIANNVALQTIGYVISGFTNVYIYVRECGYQKRDIYRGLYKHFAHDEMNKYAYKAALCYGWEQAAGTIIEYQHCKRRDRSYRGYYYRLRDPVDQKQDDRRTV